MVTGKSNQKLYCKGQLLQTIKVADVALKSYQEQIFSSSKKMFIEDDLTKLYPHFSGQIQYHFELNIEQKNVLLELEEAYEIVQIIVNGMTHRIVKTTIQRPVFIVQRGRKTTGPFRINITHHLTVV